MALAMRVYIGRFERLFEDHTIFAGVTYTDAHVYLPGMLAVCVGLVLGAVVATVNAVTAQRVSWLVAAMVPAPACYLIVQVYGSDVKSFFLKQPHPVSHHPPPPPSITLSP